MQDEKPYGVLADAQWVVLAPLIEAVWPHGKTEPRELRRTVEAIIWRQVADGASRTRPVVDGGAVLEPLVPPRGMGAPAGLDAGAQRGCRAWHGVPGRQQRSRPPVRGGRGQKGGTSAERDEREALGRSRGGYGTKAVALADSRGERPPHQCQSCRSALGTGLKGCD